jgi:hypothetical protein
LGGSARVGGAQRQILPPNAFGNTRIMHAVIRTRRICTSYPCASPRQHDHRCGFGRYDESENNPASGCAERLRRNRQGGTGHECRCLHQSAIDRWVEVLGSERLTGATLDRLTHRCHIIESNGESHRLKDARKRRSTASDAANITPKNTKE